MTRDEMIRRAREMANDPRPVDPEMLRNYVSEAVQGQLDYERNRRQQYVGQQVWRWLQARDPQLR